MRRVRGGRRPDANDDRFGRGVTRRLLVALRRDASFRRHDDRDAVEGCVARPVKGVWATRKAGLGQVARPVKARHVVRVAQQGQVEFVIRRAATKSTQCLQNKRKQLF